MTRHTILLPEEPDCVDMGPPMLSDDEFTGRLGDRNAARQAGVTLFRRPDSAEKPEEPRRQISGPPATITQFALPVPLRHSPDRVWESLGRIALNRDRLAGNGLFVDAAQNPVTTHFDMLRTRMLQIMAERGWRRVAVTSPTHGCGKSIVAANLALSFARLPSSRSVLVDLELRNPELSRLLGVSAGPLRDYLCGEEYLENHVRRTGLNLALALNGAPVAAAAETLLDPRVEETLRTLQTDLDPAVMLFDLPHALGNDDVISILPRVDAVLLVADATRTTAEDIRACERLFDNHVPLLGVVLNRAHDPVARRYRYKKK